jgi:cellulose synthase/poly-beta-1,6-N-acetylglucosamine synthase-like glycosyltransferase
VEGRADVLADAIVAFNLAILGYLIAKELFVLGMGVLSWWELRDDEFQRSAAAMRALAGSDTTPPISVVMPAYNEEAGIAEAVRSMTMLDYPRFEVIVVNDGSTDGTVARMVEQFDMVPIDAPYRRAIDTQTVRSIYRSRRPLPVVLLDKENGGKADAVNAGVNAARYPYVLVTDGDTVVEKDALLRLSRYVVRDRSRVVAVGGNVRPVNGCRLRAGEVIQVGLPKGFVERVQVVEYLRSFLGSRPGFSRINGLLIVSGAFGLFRRQAVVEVGGFRRDHLGEDMEIVVRMHRHFRRMREGYRIAFAADAVAWTEVPQAAKDLRRQRIRWHRGLLQTLWQYRGMVANPRYGVVGMVSWPAFVAFEVLAPVVEVLGWIAVPLAVSYGFLALDVALVLAGIAIVVGVGNSLLGLYLDDRMGYYGSAAAAARLLGVAWLENFGFRQRTVWWRVRAMFWNPREHRWGHLPRRGVANLAGDPAPVGDRARG